MMGNIPEETTSFVGRQAELARIGRALDDHRLTTLIGTGGVGKTRLAVRAARQAAPRHPDGVWWADLSALHDQVLLIPTVSDAVGLADHSPRMPVDALCEWLADKRLLLVLDSCDHLRHACAHLLGEILTTAPGLTVLATGRQPLGTRGEQRIEVSPLPVEGARDALTLFKDRAATAAPSVTFDGPATASAAETICRDLEGIPLAIELAAANLRRFPLEELAGRVDERFDVLVDESRGSGRHRSLRTTVGWSHELCTPLERLLWARLAPLRGEFDEATAREVCAGGPLTANGVSQALRGLVAKSVVRRDGDRHRMLDTLRDYGRMWLTELGEERAAADRHAASFLGLARRAQAGWAGRDQISWYHRVAEAHLDLCAALDHLLAHDPEGAQELAGLVGFFWTCCGHLSKANDYARRALGVGPSEGPAHTLVLWVLGVTAALQGDCGTALTLGEECTRAAVRDQDEEGILAAAYLSGLTHLLTGDPQAALDEVDRAFRHSMPTPVESVYRLPCHLITVFALTGLGRLDEAADAATLLRTACEAQQECWTRSYADYQLALIALLQGRPEASAAHARSMLAGKHQLHDSFGIALGLDILAAAIAAQGAGAQAARVYGTGQAYWRMVGHPQRGTPELRPVREMCERQARAAVGDAAYQRAFERGQADNAEVGLVAALQGA
ncbi:NB-ARC domain-containing protein [Streptomyces sp. AM 4-1-1]|uniref:ATP-binding protein n=1 Tax=Streptomyces sp. AM 4-1-1 TaxID=3028710 RepID=UPI0023B8CE5E|nr:NB-ARC domain-containing protein [Streptomyces sp. AM 4-1-1]WEH33052.1 NB-ARC domain-containing protein [Streptomyces sp. AM 4-1-1]